MGEKKIRKRQYQKLPKSNLWKMNKQKMVKVMYIYQRTHILLKLSLPRLLAKKSSKGPLRKKQKKFRTMRSIVRKMIVSVFLLRILDQTKSAKEKKIRKHQYQKLPNSNLWKMNK